MKMKVIRKLERKRDECNMRSKRMRFEECEKNWEEDLWIREVEGEKYNVEN